MTRREGMCEAGDCSVPALGYVCAQWSVADHVRFETCFEHLDGFIERFWRTYIDGQPVADVWWGTYESDDGAA